MCKRDGLAFLGALPVDTELVSLLDASIEQDALNGDNAIPNGELRSPSSLVDSYQKTASSKLMQPISTRIIDALKR